MSLRDADAHVLRASATECARSRRSAACAHGARSAIAFGIARGRVALCDHRRRDRMHAGARTHARVGDANASRAAFPELWNDAARSLAAGFRSTRPNARLERVLQSAARGLSTFSLTLGDDRLCFGA
ncbi:hypothetical protein KTF37_11395 [Burkholderia multivorans]|uniref:hypothetical protein n=1 Tax=Burkholderia multivorans TaxID=87883 RepID=UPI001C22693D|nr:hypothetical protein [Burkholderia multivorans]MBU9677456.1 hypothetical protein [Burkholderia multivorans]